jgi:putative phosphoesterase
MTTKTISRFAAIADIHGNSDALRAVLADIAGLGIDTIVNLGDHVSGPLAARETADVLIASDMTVIRGNHDRWVATTPVNDMGRSDQAARAQLDDRHIQWLRALPATATLNDGDIFLCHGTPASDTTYWMEGVQPNGTIGLRSRAEIEAEASNLSASLILCGHTHIPRAVRLSGNRLLVNPGSVGCPGYEDDKPAPHVVQAGTPDASYVILERTEAAWCVTFRHVPYDSRRMVAFAEREGRAEWARALATGWVTAAVRG